MVSSLAYGVRCLLWFPFAVTSSLTTLVIVNVGVYIYVQQFSAGTFWLSLVLCGLTMPIEHTLRPPPRQPNLKRPTERPILPQLAGLMVKDKGQAPSLAHARRVLPKELRSLLAAPVSRPPEAVLHDVQVKKQLAAQDGRQAA